MREKIFRLFSRPKETIDLPELTRLVRRFTIEQQQVPREVLDLVVLKYLPEVPPAPVGQRFVIDRKRVEVRLEDIPVMQAAPAKADRGAANPPS